MMHRSHIAITKEFDISTIPDLHTVVLAALELFSEENIQSIPTAKLYKHPLVVGSGGAESAGRIIFGKTDAVLASESNYEEKLENSTNVDGLVLISASGGKHAPIIAEKAKERGKQVMLITNTKDAPAEKFADATFVYPKNREPYTYNTSTYMGMILGHTGEDPAQLSGYLTDTITELAFPSFEKYDKFYFIVPPQFANIIRMLQLKFIELFGRRIARDIETSEYIKHATTVVPSNELFVSFGVENTQWGSVENRFHVPLPKNADYGAMMAVSYYIIGKIQAAHPPYFKDNIEAYAKEASKVFGHTISPIVE